MMDQGTIGSIFTVVVFIVFIGIVWWAYSDRNKQRFDEAANLPFADEADIKEESTSRSKNP